MDAVGSCGRASRGRSSRLTGSGGPGGRVVVAIAGGPTGEYVALTERLAAHPAVAMIEVNIACPNVESRGQVFACGPAASARVISAVRRTAAGGIPILAKLSPDVTDIPAT